MIKKIKDRNKLKIKKLLYKVGGGVGGLGGWVGRYVRFQPKF